MMKEKHIQAALLALLVGSSAKAQISPENATYMIDHQAVRLEHGRNVQPAAPGSAAKQVTEVVGPSAQGELDGRQATAVFVRQDSGGSGTFYYLAVVFGGGISPGAFDLGDRITPKDVIIENNEIVATYLGRPKDAPMSQLPSVKVVRRLSVTQGRLTESH